MDHERTRFFIVTTGRTGSTFLAAMLADAGAAFGMPAPRDWNPHAGEFELHEFSRATILLGFADRMSPTLPANPVTLAIWRMYHKQAQRRLKAALGKARFVKANDADLALQPALHLGFAPRVILNVRRLEHQVASQLVRSKFQTGSYLTEHYVKTLRNGLAALAIYGGCVVTYEDLEAPGNGAAIGALAEVTGLPAEQMRAFRDRNWRGQETLPAMPRLCLEAARLFEEADGLRGQVFAPTRPAERAVAERARWRATAAG